MLRTVTKSLRCCGIYVTLTIQHVYSNRNKCLNMFQMCNQKVIIFYENNNTCLQSAKGERLIWNAWDLATCHMLQTAPFVPFCVVQYLPPLAVVTLLPSYNFDGSFACGYSKILYDRTERSNVFFFTNKKEHHTRGKLPIRIYHFLQIKNLFLYKTTFLHYSR